MMKGIVNMESQNDFLSFINDAIWSFDLRKQEFSYVNQKFADIYDLSLDDLRRSPFMWRKFVHPEDYYYVNNETEKVYHGQSVDLEYRILVKGNIKWVSDKKYPVVDQKGNTKMIAGVISDITKKKEELRRISDSEYIYRSLFENNPNPLWIYDVQTLRFLSVNRAAVEKYGYSESEFLSMTIADIRPVEEIRKLVSNVKKLQRFSHSEGWKHIAKDGQVMYVNISGYGINYKGHKAEIVMVHDITHEVKSREEITLAKLRLDALINNINDLIWSVDRDYKLLSSNTSFEELTKMILQKSFRSGDSVLNSYRGEEGNRMWKNYYDRVLEGERIVFNITLPLEEAARTFEIRMRPIMKDQEIIGVVCVGRDIQKRLDAEKRMLQQNIELREIVSLASHEIRGPVTSLMGLINIFNKNSLSDPFNKEIIEHIEHTIKDLDSVIHKIVEKSYSIQVDNEATYSSLQNQSDYE